MIFINSTNQTLYYFKDDNLLIESKISTSKYGLGCSDNSFKTPSGLHRVASKIGKGLPLGTLFRHRKPTSRIVTYKDSDDKDYITTRIMRLSGLENGHNKGEGVDSFKRYIYIHGTPYVDLLGSPHSKGCIRMSNHDIVKLFDLVEERTLVLIV